jgi:hypothetical protein
MGAVTERMASSWPSWSSNGREALLRLRLLISEGNELSKFHVVGLVNQFGPEFTP